MPRWNLAENEIKHIPAAVSQAWADGIVNFTDNPVISLNWSRQEGVGPVQRIPPRLAHELPRLQHLRLDRQLGLLSLPPELGALSKLRSLSLRWTPLHDLPQLFRITASLHQLDELDLSGIGKWRGVECIPRPLPS